MNFKPLYSNTTKGELKKWWIEVVDNKSTADIIVHWQSKEGSVEQTSGRTIAFGKNIGKSNETKPYDQALLEAESQYKKKMDEGYTQTKFNFETNFQLPMLAHRYQDRGHDIIWSAYIQPKLNGIRCQAFKKNEKTIKYVSRKGKEYILDHLNESILNLNFDGVLDGEIYHPELTFQEICSAVKKENSNTKLLQYWIFDTCNIFEDFEQRYNDLAKLNLKMPLVLVPTILVDSEEEMLIYHKKWTEENFEGTIIRNKKGKYVYKHRSKNLQKYKTFQDAEYEIIDGYEGTGTCAGTVTFLCKTKEGKEFHCQPNGSWEIRHDYLINLDKLKGKMLTVKFQNLSDPDENGPGVPIFGKGLSIRDYE